MPTLTKRERFDELQAELRSLADRIDSGDHTDGDLESLIAKTGETAALMEELKAAAAARGAIDVASAFIGDAATAAGESGGTEVRDGIVNPKGMTLGEAFVKSPAYAEFVGQYRGNDGKIREVTSLKSGEFEVGNFAAFDAKTLVTGLSDTSGGAFVRPFRYPVVSDLIGARELTVRDLCTNISINSDTFEFVTVTGKTNNAAPVLEATTAADAAISGASPGPYTVATASGTKPESELLLAVVSAIVETIAHLMPVTRRAAADAPQVRALIDAFLIDGLNEEVEDQILNGSGTSPNIRGILQTVGISTVGSAGTDIDAVVDAIRTIRADRRRPTGLVVHPNDWYSSGFLTAKETTGAYLLGDPRASVEQLNTLWGLRVVVTEAMTENTALVGDFRQYVVADRMQNTIYVTDSHKDWFGRNLLAVLAETRIAGGCLDPDAFCTITAL